MPNPRQSFPWGAIGEPSTRRSFALWIWSTLLIIDAVLLTRRLSGQFQTPLPIAAAFLATALVAAVSGAASILFSAGSSQPMPRRSVITGLCVLPTLLWSLAISVQASPLTTGLLMGIVLMQTLLQAAPRFDMMRILPAPPEQPAVESSRLPRVPDHAQPLSQAFPAMDLNHEPTGGEEIEETGEEPIDEADESQTHWMSRRRTSDGERIEGWVRVPFESGQRETVVHISFCPPLAGSPVLETHDLEGTGIEIRAAAVFPFGARLSIRRSGTLDARHSDRVGFVAQSDAASRAA